MVYPYTVNIDEFQSFYTADLAFVIYVSLLVYFIDVKPYSINQSIVYSTERVLGQ